MMRFFYSILFLSCLLFSNLIYSNYLYGLDGQWKSLGNDSFEIRVSVYYDCSIGGSSISFSVRSDSCSSNNIFNVNNYFSSGEDITPVCPTVINQCNAFNPSFPYGIGKGNYVFKIFLGGNYSNCCWCKIHIVVSDYPTISTGNFGSTPFDMWLNRCISDNTSPQFSYNPLLIKFASQDIIFNNGIYDIDGDSISYELANPRDNIYNTPWSKNFPLTCNGYNLITNDPNSTPIIGFNFDSLEGSYKFNPIAVQKTVLRINIIEWRKINAVYKIIGKTFRECILNIIASNSNSPPTITTPKVFEVCAGQQICFNINSFDINSSDHTYMNSNNMVTIQNSNFTIISGSQRLAIGQFCWTPDTDKIREIPYYFNVAVFDDECPMYGTNTYTFSIKVVKRPNIQTHIKHPSCYSYDAIGNSSNPLLNSTRSWNIYYNGNLKKSYSNQDSIRYNFDSSGTYIFKYTLSNAGCLITHYDTINFSVPVPLKLKTTGDTTICKNSNIVLQTLPLNGQAPYSYKWFLNGSLVDTTQSITVAAFKANQYFVEVVSRDSCHLFAKDSVIINADTSRLDVVKLNDTTICKGVSLKLIPGIVSGKSPFQFSWYRNNSLISTSPVLSDTPTQANTYTLKIISADNCYNIFYDTVVVSFYPNTLLLKLPKDTTVCANVPVALKAAVDGASPPYSYNWCPKGKACSNLENPVYNFDSTTQIVLEVISSDLCKFSSRDTMMVHIFPMKQLTIFPSTTNINKGQSLILKSNAHDNFNWNGVDIITNWGDSVLVKPISTSTYYLIANNINGCRDTASILINVSNVGVGGSSISDFGFRIFPNPAKGEIIIVNCKWLALSYVEGLMVNYSSYIIENSLGQTVLNGILKANEMPIDIHALVPGIYFIRIGNEVKKFVKE